MSAAEGGGTPSSGCRVTGSCTLKWTDVSKTVVEREASQGLMRSSISKPQQQQADGLHNKKVILNQVSGIAFPGQVLAVMGPSGSGKTTLLDVLAGRRAYNAGNVSIQDQGNQSTVSRSVKQVKRKIAYITQSDSFFGHLTVRDQLTYTALLRLPKEEQQQEDSDHNSDDKHTQKVNHMLSLFRLHNCADTQIRFTSGGEKKRVNICTELLTDPTLILLDEPTTGLDSTSAFDLLQMLRSLAMGQQKTIVTSLHQPNSAMYQTMFHSVVWITDGCVVFQGRPIDSMSWLEKHGYPCPPGYNVADYWMDLLVVAGGTDEQEDGSSMLRVEEEQYDNKEESSRDLKNTKQQEELENGQHDDNTPDKGMATGPRRLSFLLQNKSDRQERESSILDMQLRSSFANLIAPCTSKSILMDAWRRHQESQRRRGSKEANRNPQFDPSKDETTPDTTGATLHEHTTAPSIEDTNHHSSKKEFNASWWTQFKVLTHRSMKNSRSAIFTLLNVVKSCCLGVLTGFLWFQMPYREEYVEDRSSYYFFTMTFWIFDSLFGALFAFPEERVVILKERASGSYHLSAYFMAKTLSEAPVTLILPLIYVCISYWMARANTSFVVFIGTLGINLLGVLAGESIGLLVGATVLDFEQALALLVVVSVTLMAAGGYYIDNIPSFFEWFQYLSPFTYAYNGSVQLAFDQNVPCDDSQVLEVVCGEDAAEYATPAQVFDFLGVNGTVAFNTTMIVVLIIVPRTMAFWALKLKKGDERP